MIPDILKPLTFLLAGVVIASAQVPPGSSTPEEQARFLAGIPLPRQSALAPLQQSPEYRVHQKTLQEQWNFCRQIRYGAMQHWASDHLARYPVTRGVLRYLFGGPDFLNAYAFFPDTRVMVLGGLEPVGEVPPPEALSPAALGPALQSLDEALHTSLFAGYFITTEMKPQLAAGAFRGVLPVLYTELALTGNSIDSVSMERPFGSPGVRIVYHRPGGPQQTLWYFQADLSNGKECRRFLAWLGELGPGASYLKAASYLLPLDSFSETRNFLTRTSELILQDDSGLPYRCFLPGEWHLSLYGVYTDPLPIFKLQRDPALTEAYASPLRVGSLPFGAGYHVRATDANLLLAVRENQAVGQPVTVPAAPAAVPAFTTPSPTPRPAKVRIRKALPVPIRKAIPVATPTMAPIPVVAAPPVVVPQPVNPPAPIPAPPAQAPVVEAPPLPAPPVVAPSQIPAPSSEPPSVPTPPVEQPVSVTVPSAEAPVTPAPVQENPVPLTGDGRPID
jgi:hypothetical protein